MVSISKIALLLSLHLTILFPLGGAVASGVKVYIIPPMKVDILIYNFVSKKLTIHCKDKHHDLGTFILNYEEIYKFSIKPNFFVKVTLYFCTFKWVGGSHSFDIYDENRDNCVQCVWSIFETGPCLHYRKYNVCFPWKH
ncbi:uncharacterized protein HKW66_Vig0257050 [Vigna angularis]|uniref:S-protein homolog n=1 Tax=Phaseolus angularis TaxID=3914 RepID=A0A8T0JX27_PHAAN|nr:uncharacterized protein HKW66_Vig0257050 [Vigna angularis]